MSEHVTQRRMKAFVTGSLGQQDRLAVETHMRTCSSCRNRMLDEGAPMSEDELFPRRLRNITFGALAALLVVALAGIFWWMRSNLIPSTAVGVSSTQPEITSIRDGNGAITLMPDGRVESTYPIPGAYLNAVKESLTAQRVSVPKTIADLPKGYPSTAERKPGDFRLLAPIGTAVLTDHPKLTWESLPDSLNYTVTITSEGKPVLSSPPLLDTDWETPPLHRGSRYEWQVSAARAGQRVAAVKMPAGDAAFFVLDEEKARELEELAQANPTAHLLLGVAFAGAGAIERAEDELSAVVRNNPRTYSLKSLIANLRPGIQPAR
jgi:hypothetical protein